MSTAQAVAICRPSRPGADIWQRMGGRVWVPGSGGVSSINGLVGLARPNHAQEAPTKEVMQLLVQLLPSSITLTLTRTRRDVSPTFRRRETGKACKEVDRKWRSA